MQTLRVLLELSPADPDRLQLLGEAAGLLGAAPPGAYPPQARGSRGGENRRAERNSAAAATAALKLSAM